MKREITCEEIDMKTKTLATFSIECNVDCPKCGWVIDLRDERESELEPEDQPYPGMQNKKDLGIEITCGNCGEEFIVDEVEY